MCVLKLYNKSRGTAILFKNSFNHTINKTIIDAEGRYIILDVTINEDIIILVNLYGPNEDKPEFLSTLKTKIGEFDNNNTVIGGDFNVVQDYTLDNHNLANRNNKK
jgi:exonuclease III